MDHLNPATRLAELFDVACQFAPNHSVQEVWENVLEPSSSEEFVHDLNQIAELIHEVERLIKQNSAITRPNLFLRDFDKLYRSLDPRHFKNGWGSTRINASTISDLQHCAARLADFMSEEELTDDELRTINERVDEVLTNTSRENLPIFVKNGINAILHDCNSAIADYKRRGVSALLEAFDRSLGTLWRLKAEFRVSHGASANDVWPPHDIVNETVEVVGDVGRLVRKACRYEKVVIEDLSILLPEG